MSRNCKNLSGGFSLLEALIAISVLTVALLGVYNLVSFGVSRAVFAKNQNIAFFLAQEGQEYINNYRLNNFLNPEKDWLDNLGPCWAQGCYVDAVNNEIKNMETCSGDCSIIKFDSAIGYNYASGSQTPAKFKREIKIQRYGNDEIKVEVKMLWNEFNQEKSFVLEDSLFNWY